MHYIIHTITTVIFSGGAIRLMTVVPSLTIKRVCNICSTYALCIESKGDSPGETKCIKLYLNLS